MSRIPFPTSPQRRVIAGAALCVLLALAAGIASVSTVRLRPPGIEPRQLSVAGAGARLLVDNPRSLVSDRLATEGDYRTLHKRAVLMGNLMVTRPVRERLARRADVRPADLGARVRVTENVAPVLTEPDSERRATQLREAALPYRLEVHPDPRLPSLSIYARAPTVAEAERIADAAAPAMRAHLRHLASLNGADTATQVVIEQTGAARGAIINGGARVQIFALTAVFVFLLSAATLILATRPRREARGLRISPAAAQGPGAASAPPPRAPRVGPALPLAHRLGLVTTPVPAVGRMSAGAAAIPSPAMAPAAVSPAGLARPPLRLGDWPRTTRLLPWMLAAMMAIVWLVPFNLIELTYSLPIDLKLDRLVLPFIVAVWALAIAAGGAAAPRLRLTVIHLGVGAVVVAALVSLVLQARALNGALELETSVKKLTLLASYVALFVVVASSIRRSEVPAFLKYTLGLAVACAVGMIVEYRFSYNVFYSVADLVLPGIFSVGQAEPGGIDDIGRRVVRGPAEVPLEAVAMLTMGLPIAIVGLIGSADRRRRILYGLAVAIILAAAASTERKSALLAPASVFVTLAYFRRRELLRLAPLGVLIGVVMLMLTPGAAQTIVSQLSGDRLKSVNTVSDRTSDYDAVRPDVFSHVLFGRGYGSYEHVSARIIDMELLRTLIEVGAFGLLAYVAMLGSIVVAARRPIRERRPRDSAVALSAAAAAVAWLVLSALFDVMAFPHCPYIGLWMAGLLAVVVSPERERREDARWSS